MGASEYSGTLRVKTLKSALKPDKIPRVKSAQFDESYQGICFDMNPEENFLLDRFINNQQTNDFLVKMDIKIKDKPEHNGNLQRSEPKTLFISMNKLKYGHNCIKYQELAELDSAPKNTSKTQISGSFAENRKMTLTLNSQISTSELTLHSSLPNTNQPRAYLNSITRNFDEFKKQNQVNISLCFLNDTFVCSEKNSLTSKFDAKFK